MVQKLILVTPNLLSITFRVMQSWLVMFGHTQYNFFVNRKQYIFSYIIILSWLAVQVSYSQLNSSSLKKFVQEIKVSSIQNLPWEPVTPLETNRFFSLQKGSDYSFLQLSEKVESSVLMIFQGINRHSRNQILSLSFRIRPTLGSTHQYATLEVLRSPESTRCWYETHCMIESLWIGLRTQGVDNGTLIHNILVINTKSIYIFLGIFLTGEGSWMASKKSLPQVISEILGLPCTGHGVDVLTSGNILNGIYLSKYLLPTLKILDLGGDW